MPEEIKTDSTQTTTTETPVTTVTQEALEAAWDAGENEIGNTEEVFSGTTEQVAETDSDAEDQAQFGEEEQEPSHGDKTWIGRKLKAQEDRIFARLQEMLAQNQGQGNQANDQPVQQPPVIQDPVQYGNAFIEQRIQEAVEHGRIPAIPTTPQEIFAVNQFLADVQNEQVSMANHSYAAAYTSHLQTLRTGDNDELHDEVIAELYNPQSPFNLKRGNDNPATWNPVSDATMNYYQAKAHLLEQRLSGKQPNNVFKGKQTTKPTGVSTGNTNTNAQDDLPNLDKDSLELMSAFNISPEKAKEVLKGDLPMHLRGGFR